MHYGPKWTRHPWALGREELLAKMSEADREAWLARRDAEDRLYINWRREVEPEYEHPIPLVTPDAL